MVCRPPRYQRCQSLRREGLTRLSVTKTTVTREEPWRTFRRTHDARRRERSHGILRLLGGQSCPEMAHWLSRTESMSERFTCMRDYSAAGRILTTSAGDIWAWPLVAVSSTLNTTNPVVPHVAPLGVIWHTSIVSPLVKPQLALVGSEMADAGITPEPEGLSGAGPIAEGGCGE